MKLEPSTTYSAAQSHSGSSNAVPVKVSRKTYQSPSLILYGPISELTQTGGSHSVADAFHSAGKTA
jgi:hypothetical protein